MKNKFHEWVDQSNISNVESASAFASDSERQTGFIAGTPAKSTKVNTALRQANLIACALMDVLAPNDQTIDLTSLRSAVATVIENGIKGIKVNNAGIADKVGTTQVGTSTKPIYLNSNGEAIACDYSIPSTAKQRNWDDSITTLGAYYAKVSNGLLICWGTGTSTSDNQTYRVNLPYPFKDTLYKFVANRNWTSTGSGAQSVSIRFKSPSYVEVTTQNGGAGNSAGTFDYIAIGFWR